MSYSLGSFLKSCCLGTGATGQAAGLWFLSWPITGPLSSAETLLPRPEGGLSA